MRKPFITPESAERIEAAHERYVIALSAYNRLRCDKPNRSGDPDYGACLRAAHTRVKEALAEWVMLYEHETGHKLAVQLDHRV